jgi:tRNA pseudouridine55 synthase
VGPFTDDDATPPPGDRERAEQALLPVEAGLQQLPKLTVSTADAGRLARGQFVLLRGRDAPLVQGRAAIFSQGKLVALGEVEQGEIRPRRIFALAH